jgi:hypothetical protein
MGLGVLIEHLPHINLGIRPKPTEAAVKPVEEKHAKAAERTPWTILDGDTREDRRIANLIRRSFNPTSLSEEGPFVSLTDRGDDTTYVCLPIRETKGFYQPSIWLDPKKWDPALEEFLQLAKERGDGSLRLYVSQHNASSINEEINIIPVSVDGSLYKSDEDRLTYTLSLNSHLTIGNAKLFYDLGYLNPKRFIQEEMIPLVGLEHQKIIRDRQTANPMNAGK